MCADIQPDPAHVEMIISGPPVKITALLVNRRGPLAVSGLFSTSGGPISVCVSGSGKRRSDVPPGIIGIEVRLDDDVIGECKTKADSSGQRLSFIPIWIPVAGLKEGRHVLLLHPFTRTVTDEDDFFNVTIVEYQQ